MMRGPPLPPTHTRSLPSCSTMRGLMELKGFFPGLQRGGGMHKVQGFEL